MNKEKYKDWDWIQLENDISNLLNKYGFEIFDMKFNIEDETKDKYINIELQDLDTFLKLKERNEYGI